MKKEENLVELEEEDFDKRTEEGKWIIDFWAAWCVPCKVMDPEFAEAAKEMKGKVNFAKVDVESNQELANRFEVMSIPTTILMKGGEVVDKRVGTMDKDAIIEFIEESF